MDWNYGCQNNLVIYINMKYIVKIIVPFVILVSCTNNSQDLNQEQNLGEIIEDTILTAEESGQDMCAETDINNNTKQDNPSTTYASAGIRENCFIVISKLHTCLNVYEKRKQDTVLIAHYPACLSRNKGNKQVRGDNKTPESPMNAPFKITAIQNSSSWHHDFGDGRGSILAYGNWFLRLETPGFSGIGIHGSTNNEQSVPGRASEGCVRLKDGDIIHLKENYAFVGMKVYILPEAEDLLPFEINAIKKAKANVISIASSSYDSNRNTNNEKLSAEHLHKADENNPNNISFSGWIEVTGSHVRLRYEPSTDANQFMDNNGNPIYPNKGDKLKCIGYINGFYKVCYNIANDKQYAVYISESFCKKI